MRLRDSQLFLPAWYMPPDTYRASILWNINIVMGTRKSLHKFRQKITAMLESDPKPLVASARFGVARSTLYRTIQPPA